MSEQDSVIVKALGTGNAFTTKNRQSNFSVVYKGKTLLIDCGSDARFSVKPEEVDAVFITHLHGDHYHGLEWLGFSTYYNPQLERPKLYCPGQVYDGVKLGMVQQLWENGLKASMGEQGNMSLDDYFDVHTISKGVWYTRFKWNDLEIVLVPRPHTDHETSYGLFFPDIGLYITSDVRFKYDSDYEHASLINSVYKDAKYIFHDCETSPFSSTVHPHFKELETFKYDIREKTYLYHYHDNVLEKPEEWGKWAMDNDMKFIAPKQEFVFHVKQSDVFEVDLNI